MKSYLTLLFCIGAAISCKPKVELNIHTVNSKFKEATSRIDKVEYNMHRIDTFASGAVWNNRGYALIEKDSSDDLFGFSFYGRRHDVPSEFIYDDGKTFVVSINDKKYEIGPSNYGFLGSPGGQMVSRQIFYLDSIFTSAEVVESDNRLMLKYKFADDTTYNVTDRTKIVELNKSNFLPIRITETSKLLGNKSVSQIYFSEMKINGEVKNSIQQHKNPLIEFELVQPEATQASTLLNTSLPLIALADVRNENTTVRIQPGKVILIDFWEVWCGPCIKSLTDVEKLHNKFRKNLQVVGIVTESPEDAILLLNKKGVTYKNLIGSKELLMQFGVNAIPYYLLVDKNGMITNEFTGFSPEIEKTIHKLLQGQ